MTGEHAGDPRQEAAGHPIAQRCEEALDVFSSESSIGTALDAMNAAAVLGDRKRGLAAAQYVRRHSRRLSEATESFVNWLINDQLKSDAQGASTKAESLRSHRQER